MDLRGLFEAFYDKLILRDVFGKVVPSSIFVGCVLASLLGLDTLDNLLSKMTIMLGLVVYGFSWLLGFALQYLGEVCGVLRTHPCRDGKETRDTFYRKWAEFHEIATSHDNIHAERLNIIKEACGNAAVSLASGLAIALFALCAKGMTSWYPLLPFGVVSAALAFALWRMHIIHVDRYGQFVENTIAYREQQSEERKRSHAGT